MIWSRLRCAVTDKKLVNLITGHILKAVANDVRDIWKNFSVKLAPFIGEGSPYKENNASADDIRQLLKFYTEKGKEVMILLVLIF